jgi:cytochrome c oxidase assembly protein subunit 15
MVKRIRNFYLTPRQYFVVAAVALGALTLIVLTGAAVRLTGSGLGCPDWPKCYGSTIPPGEFHALIEYGNRLLTGFVGIAVIAASVLAWRRRPFRKHLAVLGALLPVGVLCQAILGALVVEFHLAPELVMGHFILSMLLLDASFALVWLARYEPGERRRSSDRSGVWAVRGLIPLGQLTILLGTMSTAAGPHAGAHEGELVQRFDFRGGETLQWMVERHSAIAAAFGLAAIAVWLYLRRDGGDRRARRPLGVVIAMLAAQGAVGGIQWALELPAEIVWLHVSLATLTWVAMLWSVAAAGQLEPRREPSASRTPAHPSGAQGGSPRTEQDVVPSAR